MAGQYTAVRVGPEFGRPARIRRLPPVRRAGKLVDPVTIRQGGQPVYRRSGLWLLALLAGGAVAHPGDRALECEKVKQEIRYIQSKMRAGYSRAEGERMERRLRKLRALRRKACR
jgi:hypothetical protein